MSNSSPEDYDVNTAEYLLEMTKYNGGVSAVTVKDGHVLVFTKQALEGLLEQASKSEKNQIVVFIKRVDMNNFD